MDRRALLTSLHLNYEIKLETTKNDLKDNINRVAGLLLSRKSNRAHATVVKSYTDLSEFFSLSHHLTNYQFFHWDILNGGYHDHRHHTPAQSSLKGWNPVNSTSLQSYGA